MFWIFSILLLLTPFFLIAGFIKPKLYSRFFKKAPTRKQITAIFSGALVTFFILTLVTVSTVDIETPNKEEGKEVVEQTKVVTKEEVKKSVATESSTEKLEKTNETKKSPTPTPSVNEKQEIEKIVDQILEGKNNRDIDYKKDLEIKGSSDQGYVIDIVFSGDDSIFGSGSIKGVMESRMSNIYIALYKSEYNISEVAISAMFNLVDKYGNETESDVYTTVLGREEAEKVNWDSEDYMLRNRILPDVWEVLLIHPEFK